MIGDGFFILLKHKGISIAMSFVDSTPPLRLTSALSSTVITPSLPLPGIPEESTPSPTKVEPPRDLLFPLRQSMQSTQLKVSTKSQLVLQRQAATKKMLERLDASLAALDQQIKDEKERLAQQKDCCKCM